MENTLHGDINSIKKSVKEELMDIYSQTFSPSDFIPQNLVEILASLTVRLNREIGVFISRKGRVLGVCVGDHQTIQLPFIEGRRDADRLSGIRLLHTHPNGSGQLSTIDIQTLHRLKLDALIAIGVTEPVDVYAGILVPTNGQYEGFEQYGPLTLTDQENQEMTALLLNRDRAYRPEAELLEHDKENAILIGLDDGSSVQGSIESTPLTLIELEDLALTAGAKVVYKFVQKRKKIDAATYLGRGKIEEIALKVQALDANLLIFDDELSGSQIRNIENLTGVKVIDRTALILDIFAKRAISKEGKLQVELAQLNYRYPRLMGLGHMLSRQGGGIGTRGPGEKKLETDKRHIRKRIHTLETEIQNIAKKRDVNRKVRQKSSQKTIALVGYTNAGKSSLLNVLSHSDVYVEDKLFATLDPTARSFLFQDGSAGILIDTVGFIQKLPHQLVDAFQSTLEEVLYADLLLHVVDISNPDYQTHIDVVRKLLNSIGAGSQKELLVFNKTDQLKAPLDPEEFKEESIPISCKLGMGIDQLLEKMTELLKGDEKEFTLWVPYQEGWVYPYLCEHGKVLSMDSQDEGTLISAIIKENHVHRIKAFLQ